MEAVLYLLRGGERAGLARGMIGGVKPFFYTHPPPSPVSAGEESLQLACSSLSGAEE